MLVWHSGIEDPHTGGQYTVKVYSSEKSSEGDEWGHTRITLRPDSTVPGYRPIELSEDATVELRVIGELVAILC